MKNKIYRFKLENRKDDDQKAEVPQIAVFQSYFWIGMVTFVVALAIWLHPTHFNLLPNNSSETVFDDSRLFKPWVERIRSEKIVPIAFVPWYFPFSYSRKGGAPKGFSKEISELLVIALGKEMGIENLSSKFVPTILPAAPDLPIPAVSNREAAFECNATLNLADHPKSVILSNSFFVSSAHIMSHIGRPVRSIEDVRGKNLLGHEGVFQRWISKRMNDDLALAIAITPYPIIQYATILADEGKGYAIVGDALRLFNLIYALPHQENKQWGISTNLGEVGYACSMLASESELQGYLNKAIAKVLASVDYQRAYFRWFVDVQFDTQIQLNYPMPKGLQTLIEKSGGVLDETLIGAKIIQPEPPNSLAK